MSLTRRGLLQLGATALSARKLPVVVAPSDYLASTTRWFLPSDVPGVWRPRALYMPRTLILQAEQFLGCRLLIEPEPEDDGGPLAE